jgi:putative membrane protein
MGAADVVPGVSGGTIALITGIYETLINSINSFSFGLIQVWRSSGIIAVFKKVNGPFLATLLAGALTSIFSISKVLSYLLSEQAISTWSFFFGLVIASTSVVSKEIKKWDWSTISLLLIGIILAYFITQFTPAEQNNSLIYLFFSGAIAICAMILPGISGSFILIILGSYESVLNAVDERNFKIILIVALGCIFGILSFARVLKFLFRKFRAQTMAIMLGFIIGSLVKIWPWKDLNQKNIYNFKQMQDLEYAIGFCLVGFLAVILVERIGRSTMNKV